MSGPQVVVEMSANEAKMWQAFKRLEQAEGGAENALKRISGAAKESSREHRALERDAKRVYESTRTPQERYNRDLDKLKGHLEANRISTGTYSRAVEKLGQDYRKTQQSGTAAFGTQALSDLRGLALGMVGVSSAVYQVIAAFREMEQVREEAASKQLTDRKSFGKLAQLAGSEEEMKRFADAANRAYGIGAGETRGQAAELVFSLQSAGALDQLDLFAQMEARGLVDDSGNMAKSATTLKTSMGEKETGNLRAIISKAFGASNFSPATAEKILEAASRSGVAAGEMGIADEEVLAATAILSKAKGNAEEAGTYQAQMMRTLLEKGAFKGKSLVDIIDEIDRMEKGGADAAEIFGWSASKKRLMEMGLTDDQATAWFKSATNEKDARNAGLTVEQYASRYWATEAPKVGLSQNDFKEWFGRAQGQEAYTVLRNNMAELRQAIRETQQAQTDDYVGKKLGLADSVPELAASRQRDKATKAVELATLGSGTWRNLSDAYIEERRAKIRDHWGGPTWSETAYMASMDVNRWGYGDEEFLRKEMQRPGIEELISEDLRKVINKRLSSANQGELSPDAQRQVDSYYSGDASVVQVVPVPTASSNNRQIDRTNELLEKINNTLDKTWPQNSRSLAQRPEVRPISPPLQEDR